MFNIRKMAYLSLLFIFLSAITFAFGGNIEIKTVEPQILVIFGAKGDLSKKKLFPAIYSLYLKQKLPEPFVCIGTGRSEYSHDEFRQHVLKTPALQDSSFSNKICYIQADFKDDTDYENLKKFILEIENQFQTKGNRIFYLATSAFYFPTIIQKLKQHKLIYESFEDKWSRVIIEKPLGHDYQSALELKNLVEENLDDSQIFLIDHYLGKEVVQNLLTFRFLNPIFETLWNRNHIESVHIHVGEDIGIEERGKFWEETGLLRDVVQNHIMQIIALIAMEKPLRDCCADIRQEKIALLKSIRPFPVNQLEQFITRGQYGSGIVKEKKVKGYREEIEVSSESNVETYVATKLFIDTPRWEGVPFFVTAGKRLKEKLTQIVIKFRQSLSEPSNALIFRVQPDEEISFLYNSKIPNVEGITEIIPMKFNYFSHFQNTLPDAYEKLLHHSMMGDKSLFVSFEEALISWQLLTPVLDFWKNNPPKDFPNYPAGSGGPLNIFLNNIHQN